METASLLIVFIPHPVEVVLGPTPPNLSTSGSGDDSDCLARPPPPRAFSLPLPIIPRPSSLRLNTSWGTRPLFSLPTADYVSVIHSSQGSVPFLVCIVTIVLLAH
ncbi:hypothetical protein FB451DRAFT_1287938 [Mycena latifolia]|nr:hypothetical protein FB451DRAFT_1287938 [Mycena latifolia]